MGKEEAKINRDSYLKYLLERKLDELSPYTKKKIYQYIKGRFKIYGTNFSFKFNLLF